MPESNYEQAWERLRAKEETLKLLSSIFELARFVPLLAGPVIFVLLFLIVDGLGIHSLPLQIGATVLIIGAIMNGLLRLRYSFPCPRCGNSFFVKKWTFPLETGDGQECVHCQLPRGAEAPLDDPAKNSQEISR